MSAYLYSVEALVPGGNDLAAIGDPKDDIITKGAVKGLTARIALFSVGYSFRSNATLQQGSNPQTYYHIAKDECNDIMNSGQHNLNPSFRRQFFQNIWRMRRDNCL